MVATILRAATLFSVFLVAGCGSRDFHCTLHGEAVGHRDKLEVAAQLWNEVSDSKIYLDNGDDVDIYFVDRRWLLKYANDLRSGIGQPPFEFDSLDGLYENDRGQRKVWLADDLRGISLIGVGTHEFGHLLGLRHTDGGLMDPNGGFPIIDPITLAECRRVNVCP